MAEAKKGFRIEKDSMGEMQVPETAYYGAQTQRAAVNFPISGIRFSRPMIAALGLIKRSAAQVNKELGLLDAEREAVIAAVAKEVESGALDEHFVLDIFQTGSGTSSNMNTNEVIANRAKEVAKGELTFHPNDHVNMSQSSNDVIPTAIHIAVATEIKNRLIPALRYLEKALGEKAEAFQEIVKTGRTHLMDATPITLGQEFSGYQSQITHGIERLERVLAHSLSELALGGTAVGTGVNTPKGFSQRVIEVIRENSGIPFIEARNHFEAQAAKDALVETSGQLKTVAASLGKIANDVRWLGSGPRCGLGELFLPEVQPGSSIMPGKVNPVIAESVLMVVCQVMGNDAAVNSAALLGGNFELHVLMPVIAHNVLQAVELLSTSAMNFADRCVIGIRPNLKRVHELAEASITVVTALAPRVGYDLSAKLAKEAFETGESLRAVALRHKVLPEAELDQVLDLMSMTRPGL
jgi:fumarate hydratase class II